MVENEWEDQIKEFNRKQIDIFINEIREATSKIQKPIYLTRDEIEKRVKMSIPLAQKDKYLNLLFIYRSVISKDMWDLGIAKNFFHQIVLNDNAQVYRKQYQIQRHTTHLSKKHSLNG